eukprot:g11831.t1
MSSEPSKVAKKTKAQKRREKWDKRLENNNGTLPGGRGKASPLSKLLFSWIGPLVQLAYARPLEPEHLFPLPESSDSSELLERFHAAWGEQLAKPKGQRSLARAMVKVFKCSLIVTAVLALCQQVVLLSVPLVVQQLLGWLIDENDDRTYVGVIWAVALFIVGFCGNGLMSNHYFLYLYVLGMDARTMLNGVTYAKSLRLSNKARQGTSTGELVTLMSNDAQRLPDMSLSVHAIWSTPLFIAIAIFLLVRLVGTAAVAGLLFLVGIIPVQGMLAAKQMGLQRAQMKQTESRVKVVNEVLQGIRIVKYYAWEAPFVERISGLRDVEVDKIKNFAFINAYTMSIMLTTPFVMVMLTLVVYFNGDGDFSPDVVFTAVSLLLIIRFPLMMLPMAIASWVQGKVSLGRMQKFFELEELDPKDREWTNRSGNGRGAGAVSISGTYVWTPTDDDDEEASKSKDGVKDTTTTAGSKSKGAAVAGEEASGGDEVDLDGLKKPETPVEVWDLQLQGVQIPSGKLTAVVGQVGSGKSSLLSALLGDMTKVEGEISIDGSVAYVAQTAWIINATLKDNVLMGRPFDEARYRQVLDVCDMKQDLAQLPAGDETEIGEKGINLSGGQKQRVSIARAAYADADVYILDDPLSAVDAHVGRHLFDECLAGFLKGKTIILCANQLQFLSQTDRVLVVHEGRIVEEGAYSELLMLEGGGLAKLMEAFAEDDSGDEDDATPAGNQESKEGDLLGDATVRFAKRPGTSIGTPSRPPRRLSRTISGADAYNVESVDTPWTRSVREASDTSAAMVGGYGGAGCSPVPKSATRPDDELLEAMHSQGFEDNETDDEDDNKNNPPSLGIMGMRNRRKSGSMNDDGDRRGPIASRQFSGERAPSVSRQYSGERASSMSRQYSDGGSERPTKSASAVAQEALAAGGALQTVEGREEGAVALRVFKIYFKDGAGGWFLPIVLVIVSVLTQVVSNVFDWWLSFWSDKFLEDGATSAWYQYVYAGLCVGLVSMYLVRALLFATQAVKSSRHLHDVLTRGVMRAPVSFFDTTPIGRVLNRFTKDMDSIDLLLPRNVPQFVATLSVLIGVMITIVIVLPWFLIVIVPVGYCYYKVQDEFINRNSHRLNDSSTAFYHMHVSNRWLGIRLEMMGTTMTLAAALFIVFSKGSGGLTIKGGVAGLVLTYTQQVTGYLTWAVRMGCETEARITAVERAQEYADLTPEALPIVEDYRPPKGWPANGAVKLEGIKMRYRPGLDLVLKGVTLDIKGGERIGIAGRTGSGKSSLMVSLFRMVEPCGGSITIDGVDALRVGLQDLREAISIIPQDPVMFCGTMRENLDPFGRSDDVTIWAALEAARLAPYVSGLEGKLDAEVSEGGENLSLGQRQLVCLARAVLRRNRILVMDEATANVDVDTDSLIQEAIRKEFSGCTVLTIAHRLNTIMDSDRILVMQDGRVGEFDTPANLVANPRSLLMGFIRQTGSGSSRRLVGIATNANAPSSSSSSFDEGENDANDVSNRTASTVASASHNGNETDSASPPSTPDTDTAAVAAAAAVGASEEQAAVPAVAAAAVYGAGAAEGGDQAGARGLSQVAGAAGGGHTSGTVTPAAVAGASPWTSQSPKPTE